MQIHSGTIETTKDNHGNVMHLATAMDGDSLLCYTFGAAAHWIGMVEAIVKSREVRKGMAALTVKAAPKKTTKKPAQKKRGR